MRKGYVLIEDREKLTRVGHNIRPVPDDFVLITSTTTDSETDSDSVIWEEELMVEGFPAYFGVGYAVTRETKKLGDRDGERRRRQMLRLTVWEIHERIRLGCYKWLPVQEAYPDASDVA